MRPADVQRTAETYGVEPVWFPGMGHDVMLDRPDELTDLLLDIGA